jgi:hypothetical protein
MEGKNHDRKPPYSRKRAPSIDDVVREADIEQMLTAGCLEHSFR